MAGTNRGYNVDDILIFDQSDSIEGDSAAQPRDGHDIFHLGQVQSEEVHSHHANKLLHGRGPPSSHSSDHSKQYSYCGSVDSGLGSTTKSTVSSSSTIPSGRLSSTRYSAKSSGYNSNTPSSDDTFPVGEISLSDHFEKELKLTDSVPEKTRIDEQCHSEYFRNLEFADDQHLRELPQPELYSDGFQLTKEALNINEDGDMSLHLAIIFLQIDVALILISLFPPEFINHANKLRQTPLHLSVLTRQPRLTRALVLAGANLEIPDRNGNTALHLACSNNYLDCVGALTHPPTIKEVTDYLGETTPLRLPQIPQSLELKNYEGYACIHIATFNSNTDLLSYLVQHGANVNATDDKSGRRPVHYAVEMNNEDLTDLLVRKLGADVNSTTFDLNTPLHLATGRDFIRLVHLLMDCGASRQAVNSEGLRPYQMATSDKLRRLLQVIEYSDFSIGGM